MVEHIKKGYPLVIIVYFINMWHEKRYDVVHILILCFVDCFSSFIMTCRLLFLLGFLVLQNFNRDVTHRPNDQDGHQDVKFHVNTEECAVSEGYGRGN